MPLALLLSPDDQAVSAITAVLEEMLVTWERPLDGVSAAQKLNSSSFDLVLVDCENLPAAKLIFDVCRRGKGGNNPVPIAIVDGRAGLPTAFRLGAELILTKPVAKDQARTTIRTAVGRVKKDEPVRASHAPVDPTAVQNELPQPPPQHGDFGTSFASSPEGLSEEHALAASATTSQLMSYSDPFPVSASSAPALTMTMAATAVAPEIKEPLAATSAAPVVAEPRPSIPPALVATPALAESEKAEPKIEAKAETKVDTKAETKAEPNAEPKAELKIEPKLFMFDPPSKKETGKKEASSTDEAATGRRTSRPLVAVLVLVLIAGGFYGAWMYAPGFKTLAQPQVDRALTLVGMAHPAQPTVSSPVKPAVEPANRPPVATSAEAVPPSQSAGTEPSAAAGTSVPASSVTPAPTPTAVPNSTSPSAATSAAAVAPAATDNPSTAAKPAKTELAKTDASTRPDTATKISGQPAPIPVGATGTRNLGSGAAASEAELPGEKNAIILSSKGAEKRLIHSVPATYPSGVKAVDAQGTLVLKTVVDEDGKVTGARVIDGNAALANAAISTVKQWRYRPYVRDGKSLPFQTIVLLDFQRP